MKYVGQNFRFFQILGEDLICKMGIIIPVEGSKTAEGNTLKQDKEKKNSAVLWAGNRIDNSLAGKLSDLDVTKFALIYKESFIKHSLPNCNSIMPHSKGLYTGVSHPKFLFSTKKKIYPDGSWQPGSYQISEV